MEDDEFYKYLEEEFDNMQFVDIKDINYEIADEDTRMEIL